MFGKRLINTGGAVCPSDVTDLFEDGSGMALYRLNSNADDSSGNYNGTATDVTYVSGYINNAGSFNGSSSGIATLLRTNNWISNYNDKNVNFSYSCWFKNITNDSEDRRIISLGMSSEPYQYIGIKQYLTELRFEWWAGLIYGPQKGGSVKATMPIDNNWHNIVCIRESSYLKMYLDGVYIGQTQQTDDLTISTSIPLVIGANDSNLSFNFNGSIDQVRIFDRAITAEEVTTLYNEVAC